MKPLKSLVAAAALALVILSSGCATHMPITYNMDDIAAQEKSQLANATLDVEVFDDARDASASGGVWFSGDKNVTLDGKSYCINAEKNYEKGTVNIQISQLIAEHLKKRGAFKSVSYNQRDSADYYVVGKIKQFSGKREFSSEVAATKTVSAGFGLLGAIVGSMVTAAVTMPGVTEIEFSEISIYKKDGSLLAKLQDVNEKKDQKIHADGRCWSIYATINQDLKVAVAKLSGEIEEIILKQQTETASTDKVQ